MLPTDCRSNGKADSAEVGRSGENLARALPPEIRIVKDRGGSDDEQELDHKLLVIVGGLSNVPLHMHVLMLHFGQCPVSDCER